MALAWPCTAPLADCPAPWVLRAEFKLPPRLPDPVREPVAVCALAA